MSHIPQRKEKDCLNCGTVVQGKYCQNCGQENVVFHETFWHMVKHFLYDITHFDSKFFDSMKYLFFRPGFLPQEYNKGKRVSYLNPIKKYVFTSAIFFLLFFSFFINTTSIEQDINAQLSIQDRTERIKRAEKELIRNSNNDKLRIALLMLKDTGSVLTLADLKKYWNENNVINFGGRQYNTLKEYDSVQKALIRKEKDSWFVRQLQQKNLKVKEKYGNYPGRMFKVVTDTFLHNLPYLLFISLPLFAFILKLLYIRRKSLYYVDHGIFSLYHYIFTFFLLLIVFCIDKLQKLTNISEFDFLMIGVFLLGGVYLYLAMKRFYGQGHGKTFLKFLLLNILGTLLIVTLFVASILFSVFQI